MTQIMFVYISNIIIDPIVKNIEHYSIKGHYYILITQAPENKELLVQM